MGAGLGTLGSVAANHFLAGDYSVPHGASAGILGGLAGGMIGSRKDFNNADDKKHLIIHDELKKLDRNKK